jgi:hypothetical protein
MTSESAQGLKNQAMTDLRSSWSEFAKTMKRDEFLIASDTYQATMNQFHADSKAAYDDLIRTIDQQVTDNMTRRREELSAAERAREAAAEQAQQESMARGALEKITGKPSTEPEWKKSTSGNVFDALSGLFDDDDDNQQTGIPGSGQ